MDDVESATVKLAELLRHPEDLDKIPGLKAEFTRKNEEVWDWRYLDATQKTRMFNVHFDRATGRVTGTSASPDPQANY